MKKSMLLSCVIVVLILCGYYGYRAFKSPKVLILGNSITQHAPAKEIGWSGSWGMAASKESKDYAHLVTSALSAKDVMIKKLPTWETTFNSFNFKSIDKYRDFKPDIFIYQFGENIPAEFATENNYSSHAKQFIDYISAPKTVIISEFWPEPTKYQAMKKLAEDNGYIFVDISDVMFIAGTMAKDEYESAAVGLHPSDKGMQIIADRVIKAISNCK